MEHISFFCEDILFELKEPEKIATWIGGIAEQEQVQIEELNYIFCTDEYLLGINRQYLDHDYYTDIITFNNSNMSGSLLSDIFISIDRVRENALDLEVAFEDELFRVMIHGLLHLVGYDDKQEEDRIRMRKKEDACLSLLK